MFVCVYKGKNTNFAGKLIKIKVMGIIELEVRKAGLAREILCMEAENIINSICLLLKKYDNNVFQQKTLRKRQLGILDGKAKIVFKDDFEMTTEELLDLQ